MRRALQLFPLLLLLLAMGWASHQSSMPLGVEIVHPWDKVLHGILFASLGLAAGWALEGRLAWLWILGLLVLIGGLDEFHQSFVPGREVSLGDVVADGVGAALGLVVWGRLRKGHSRADG